MPSTASFMKVQASDQDGYQLGPGLLNACDITSSTMYLNSLFGVGSEWIGLLFAPTVAAAPINSATLRIFISDPMFNDADFRVHGNDVDDASEFTTGANDISSRASTTAVVDFTQANAGGVGDPIEIDVTSIVSEICLRPGWSNANRMAFMLEALSNDQLGIYAWDGDPDFAAELEITFGAFSLLEDVVIDICVKDDPDPLSVDLEDFITDYQGENIKLIFGVTPDPDLADFEIIADVVGGPAGPEIVNTAMLEVEIQDTNITIEHLGSDPATAIFQWEIVGTEDLFQITINAYACAGNGELDVCVNEPFTIDLQDYVPDGTPDEFIIVSYGGGLEVYDPDTTLLIDNGDWPYTLPGSVIDVIPTTIGNGWNINYQVTGGSEGAITINISECGATDISEDICSNDEDGIILDLADYDMGPITEWRIHGLDANVLAFDPDDGDAPMLVFPYILSGSRVRLVTSTNGLFATTSWRVFPSGDFGKITLSSAYCGATGQTSGINISGCHQAPVNLGLLTTGSSDGYFITQLSSSSLDVFDAGNLHQIVVGDLPYELSGSSVIVSGSAGTHFFYWMPDPAGTPVQFTVEITECDEETEFTSRGEPIPPVPPESPTPSLLSSSKDMSSEWENWEDGITFRYLCGQVVTWPNCEQVQGDGEILQQSLFAASDGLATTDLRQLNSQTGVVTSNIGDMGYGISGIAQNPNNVFSVFAVTTWDDSIPGAANLLIGLIPDPTNPTVIGPLGMEITDITFGPGNVLYGWSAATNDLVTIDTGSGTATVVGDSGLGVMQGGGIAYDFDNGWIIVSASGANGDLHAIDPLTGAVLSTLSTLNGGAGTINSLSFNCDGSTLLGAISGVPSRLVRIDPDTGDVTDRGSGIDNMDTLAFLCSGADETQSKDSLGTLEVATFNPFVQYLPLRCDWNTDHDAFDKQAIELLDAGTSPTLALAVMAGITIGLQQLNSMLVGNISFARDSLFFNWNDPFGPSVEEPPEVVPLSTAISGLLTIYGLCNMGGQAVLHVPLAILPQMISRGLAWREGDIYRGPQGSIVISEAAYGFFGLGRNPQGHLVQGDVDGAWIYVSGPIEYALGEPYVVRDTDNRRQNTYEVIAERQVVYRFNNCCLLSARVPVLNECCDGEVMEFGGGDDGDIDIGGNVGCQSGWLEMFYADQPGVNLPTGAGGNPYTIVAMEAGTYIIKDAGTDFVITQGDLPYTLTTDSLLLGGPDAGDWIITVIANGDTEEQLHRIFLVPCLPDASPSGDAGCVGDPNSFLDLTTSASTELPTFTITNIDGPAPLELIDDVTGLPIGALPTAISTPVSFYPRLHFNPTMAGTYLVSWTVQVGLHIRSAVVTITVNDC